MQLLPPAFCLSLELVSVIPERPLFSSLARVCFPSQKVYLSVGCVVRRLLHACVCEADALLKYL